MTLTYMQLEQLSNYRTNTSRRERKTKEEEKLFCEERFFSRVSEYLSSCMNSVAVVPTSTRICVPVCASPTKVK